MFARAGLIVHRAKIALECGTPDQLAVMCERTLNARPGGEKSLLGFWLDVVDDSDAIRQADEFMKKNAIEESNPFWREFDLA